MTLDKNYVEKAFKTSSNVIILIKRVHIKLLLCLKIAQKFNVKIQKLPLFYFISFHF